MRGGCSCFPFLTFVTEDFDYVVGDGYNHDGGQKTDEHTLLLSFSLELLVGRLI